MGNQKALIISRSELSVARVSLPWQDVQKTYLQVLPKRVEDGIKSDLPSLVNLAKNYSEEVQKAWLVDLLADFNEFVNVSKKFSPTQIEQTVDLIVMNYFYLNMTDIKLFFNNCKLGKYDKLYDCLDGQIILRWLDQYCQERIEAAAHLSISEHQRIKSLEKRELLYHQELSDDGQKYINLILKMLKEKSTKKKSNDENKTIILSPTDKMVHRWMRQFENLHNKYGLPGYIKFIKMGARVMDIQEFLELKMKNKESAIEII